MQSYNTVIIGGGQAGLSASYYLSKSGIDHVILERNERIGDQWRNRWNSLELFTPAEYNNLPGSEFPAPKGSFPGKDDVAEYFENYATEFNLPIHLNMQAREVRKTGGRYEIDTNQDSFRAENIIIATGAFQTPFIPSCHKNIPDEVLQLHSSEYNNPQELQEGDVLVVGTGNSGVQIAEELSEHFTVYLSGRDNGGVPRSFLGKDIYWWLKKIGLLNATVDSFIVKRMQKKMDGKGDPLVGRKLKNVTEECGLKRRSKVIRSQNGKLLFEEGEELGMPDNIIWATGYRPDFSWIKLNVFDEEGFPIHDRGIVKNTEGLYFLGLKLLYRVNSSLIGGVGKDAKYIATHIEKRQ